MEDLEGVVEVAGGANSAVVEGARVREDGVTEMVVPFNMMD